MSEASLFLFKADSNLELRMSSNISEQLTGSNTSIDGTSVMLCSSQRQIQRGLGVSLRPLNFYY